MREMLIALMLFFGTCSYALLLQGPTALTVRAPAIHAASCSRASTLKACDSWHPQLMEPRSASSDSRPFKTPLASSRLFSGPAGWGLTTISAIFTYMLCARWSQVATGSLALYHAYEQAALTKPLITKGVTSAVAYFLGDGLAQRFTGTGKVDAGRVSRSALADRILALSERSLLRLDRGAPPPTVCCAPSARVVLFALSRPLLKDSFAKGI
eukprot:6199525-Pleurochrysis_carterae.AAC.9